MNNFYNYIVYKVLVLLRRFNLENNFLKLYIALTIYNHNAQKQ